ncbi:mitochondrial 37S ribosomal protein mS47 [Aspergillus brunneoviolaceus CBS 621.78]|uniref:ClpP/crotonase n=1 Tax=Aspergillus brunneoviolaceus CBS 621.78 TaxID=1450534 RepID=A0ACD1GAW6_9EURO|nr:ClpP/crotonase [Aspergillus brunneoviolaceus CBS 621.78]RAH46407.1 ClpP/crotonase [Aspergillus brunneoviolaceus CBS 621.78]
MLVRHSACRFSTPSSWISRLSPATTMPLRAKVTNRAFTASATNMKSAPTPAEDDVLFSSLYGVRLIELNRPEKLNALNRSMVDKITPRLEEYKKSQLANVIMVAGAGDKAMCAGGDVVDLAEQNRESEDGPERSSEFFASEYKLDHLIATYPKPFISVMDGITMGGGVGLSAHAPFRIATERTIFAMPETNIGFFPDVGASFFLPRLDGELGTYLALTSEQLRGPQVLFAGIATHYLHSSMLGKLTQRLSELVFQDYATLPERLDLVNSTIAEFSTGLPESTTVDLGGAKREAIDRCFGHNTVEGIIEALQQANTSWAEQTLKTLAKRSPTSLKVALRQMRVGKQWSISEAFQREAHIASQFMRHPDFNEGVRALLVRKRKPMWQPASLEEVTTDMVDRFFTLPEGESRLELLSEHDYNDYPYNYGLPTEASIRRYVRGELSKKDDPIEHFVGLTGGKPGVREKVTEVLQRKAQRSKDGVWLWK